MTYNSKFIYSIYIRATPKMIWDAITNPKIALKYWRHANISSWSQGSTWTHVANDNGSTVMLVGEVLEVVPHKLLALTWIDPADIEDKSCVTFKIERIKEAACLKVTHSNFKIKSKMFENIKIGWPRVLSSMKSYLETGKALIIWDN